MKVKFLAARLTWAEINGAHCNTLESTTIIHVQKGNKFRPERIEIGVVQQTPGIA
jgi:hypothetical protein